MVTFVEELVLWAMMRECVTARVHVNRSGLGYVFSYQCVSMCSCRCGA